MPYQDVPARQAAVCVVVLPFRTVYIRTDDAYDDGMQWLHATCGGWRSSAWLHVHVSDQARYASYMSGLDLLVPGAVGDARRFVPAGLPGPACLGALTCWRQSPAGGSHRRGCLVGKAVVLANSYIQGYPGCPVCCITSVQSQTVVVVLADASGSGNLSHTAGRGVCMSVRMLLVLLAYPLMINRLPLQQKLAARGAQGRLGRAGRSG